MFRLRKVFHGGKKGEKREKNNSFGRVIFIEGRAVEQARNIEIQVWYPATLTDATISRYFWRGGTLQFMTLRSTVARVNATGQRHSYDRASYSDRRLFALPYTLFPRYIYLRIK